MKEQVVLVLAGDSGEGGARVSQGVSFTGRIGPPPHFQIQDGGCQVAVLRLPGTIRARR